MKKTRFTGYVYDFSVDYEAIAVSNIKDIHKYLMEKNNIVGSVIKKMFLYVIVFIKQKIINHNIKWEE